MEGEIRKILTDVQKGTVNHQKNLKLLENVYNSVQFEDFLKYFLRIIQGILQQDYNNPCSKLLLEFLATFVGYIGRRQTPQDESDLDDDPPTDPFFTAVISEVVKLHNIPKPECRYNACSFVSLALQNIGDKMQVDSHICDVIQGAMIENMQDPKPAVRLQAVLALVRLQDPLNPECPVIREYVYSLGDLSPLVRCEVVRRIAPNALTIPKLKDRTADIDANVRSAAFSHVADIGIRYFKIIHRQFILRSGFGETNRHVKKRFLEYLLPKWLTGVNGEYIAFLTAIKLDAEETDILNTEDLSKKVMEVFFRTEPIANLIKALPLDENKVVPLNGLQTEVTHYWNILTKHLRESEEMDEYLDSIVPELTTFCNYLEKLISSRFAKTMEDWENLDFQYMLYHLFDIAEHYDLSEEVGRRTLDSLLKRILRNHRLQPRLLSKIIHVASMLASSQDSFANEMSLIISDIREPLIEQEPSDHDKRERDFKMAELRVKLNILEGDLEDALDENDFGKAQVLKNEIEEYRRRIEAMNSHTSQREKVRVSRDDPETVCWCLELLAAVLIHGNLKSLSPSLVTSREDVLKPLIASKNAEIGWRVFKCLAAFCVFDKEMSQEQVKQLLVPIASYRVIPNFNKTVLKISISVITDLIVLHGNELFATEDHGNATSTTQTSSTRRRLYNEEIDDVGTINDQMSVEVIINVILDMLDDEDVEIRSTAVKAVTKLILKDFTVDPMVMTRLILKWYSPATQKNLQQKLGLIIKEYTERKTESKEIVAKSVIPILTNIADAPRTSPLAEVDIDNVVKFLAAITDTETTNGVAHIHKDLAHMLIRDIAQRPAEVVTPHLAKMFNYLNIAPDNLPPTRELVAQVELVLEREALDKGSKLHLTKFIAKLKSDLSVTSAHDATERDMGDAGHSSDVGSSSVSVDAPEQTTNNLKKRGRSNARAQSEQTKKKKVELGSTAKRNSKDSKKGKRVESNCEENRETSNERVEREVEIASSQDCGRKDTERDSENSDKAKNKRRGKTVTGNGPKLRHQETVDSGSTRENRETSNERVERDVEIASSQDCGRKDTERDSQNSDKAKNKRRGKTVTGNGPKLRHQETVDSGSTRENRETSNERVEREVEIASSQDCGRKDTERDSENSDKAKNKRRGKTVTGNGPKLRHQETVDSGSTRENRETSNERVEREVEIASRQDCGRKEPERDSEDSDKAKNKRRGKSATGNGPKLRHQETVDSGSTSLASTIRKRGRPRKGSLDSAKSNDQTNGIRSSSSESSRSTRSSSNSQSLCEADVILEHRLRSREDLRTPVTKAKTNRAFGKEVVRANGVQNSVQKTTSTPQVKRKKTRGSSGKNAAVESAKEPSPDLSDMSEQSLHTIVDQSDFQTSVIPDDSPEKRTRNSRVARKPQIVVSETSSDSENTNGPARSTRKKKVCNGSR